MWSRWTANGAVGHRPPSHISKMVLATVHVGPFEKARTSHLGRPRPPSQSSKMVLVSVHGGGLPFTEDTTEPFSGIDMVSEAGRDLHPLMG